MMANFGIKIFETLFQKDEQYLRLFSFKQSNKDELENHSMKVVEALDHTILKIHDISSLKPFLHELGKNHRDLGIEKYHYNHLF